MPRHVRRFLNPTEAVIAVAWLRSTGVQAELWDYYLCSLHWLIIPALGGFGLELDERQLEILDSPPPEREEATPGDLACYRRVERRRKTAIWITLFVFYPGLLVLVLALVLASQQRRRPPPPAAGAV